VLLGFPWLSVPFAPEAWLSSLSCQLSLVQSETLSHECVTDAGASEDIIVTPFDNYGNPGASGGRFAAELALEHDESAPSIPCQITESATGDKRLSSKGNRAVSCFCCRSPSG